MDISQIIATIITTIFLLIIVSYYVIMFLPVSSSRKKETFKGISIIIPAHNEEKYLAACIQSILDAKFPGKKQIIVVDDGSTDATASIAKKYNVHLIQSVHGGKSQAINSALKQAKHELIAIVDADSSIEENAIIRGIEMFEPKVAAVCSTVKVKNQKTILGMWLHIEQLYNSLVRGILAKVNANIVTPGPLSLYKRSCLHKVGGFSTKGFSEDVDIAIRLIRAGYKIAYAEKSVAYTNMPIDVKGFLRQRTRFARGWINIFKKHIKVDNKLITIYTLPLAIFWYLQAVVMGIITLANLWSGYYTYFLSKGIIISGAVIKFFFEWFSIVGIVRWCIDIASGNTPLTLFAIVAIASSLLSYPLYVIAILKYERNITLWHIIPLIFMFPFWLILMIIYMINIPELFKSKQYNIWHK